MDDDKSVSRYYGIRTEAWPVKMRSTGLWQMGPIIFDQKRMPSPDQQRMVTKAQLTTNIFLMRLIGKVQRENPMKKVTNNMLSMTPSVEIYGQPNCPYCEAAKRLAREKGLSFEYKDISADADWHREFKSRVLAATNNEPKTVPQIFVNGKHVGGFNEFSKLLKDYRGD